MICIARKLETDFVSVLFTSLLISHCLSVRSDSSYKIMVIKYRHVSCYRTHRNRSVSNFCLGNEFASINVFLSIPLSLSLFLFPSICCRVSLFFKVIRNMADFKKMIAFALSSENKKTRDKICLEYCREP